jgi:hypothetical protein
MLTIKTYLAASTIHGVGVFAGDNINKGMIVCYYNPLFDQALTPEDILKFPKPVREFIRSHAYLDSNRNRYILLADNGKYINHHNMPNTDCDGDHDVSNRSILCGEEITSNYFTFDAEAAIKLGLKKIEP